MSSSAESALDRAHRRVRDLHTFAAALSGASTIDDVARVLLEVGGSAIHAEIAAVWRVDGVAASLIAQRAPAPIPGYQHVALDVDSPLSAAIRDRQPVFVQSRDEYAARFPRSETITREMPGRAHAFACLPLEYEGEVRAVVGFAFSIDRVFDAMEREFLLLLARQAALAFERGMARATEAAAAHRLRKLQEATAALAEARTPRDVAAVTVQLGAEAVDAVGAVMWLAAPDGSLVMQASHRIPTSYLAQFASIPPDSSLPAVQVFRDGTTLWVEGPHDFARVLPELVEQASSLGRLNAFAALPLTTRQRCGVLSFSYAGEHRFSDNEKDFLRALVATCEHALERAQLYVVEADARVNAEQASTRKDEFLAMLGHELRNPLAAMLSAMDLIKMRDGSLSRELSIMDRQLGHLVHLVGDLLDVSRITQGKITLQRKAIDLADAIEHAIELARPLIDRHGHQLEVSVPPNLLLDADRDRLCQVIANLLSNSARFTPRGGKIELVAELDPRFATISVRDNGAGISAILLPNLFDMFVQGERAMDRREGGLGVGLTIVRTVVELHGGSVHAHSDGPGKGATFTLRWPRATPETVTAKIPAVDKKRGKPLQVLIVDDHVDSAEVLADMVNAMGHDTFVAHDAESGLAIAQQICPDLALLDIGLPVVDGYELARRLRTLPHCANTPIVAITGRSRDEDRDQTTRAGFARHLVKPVALSVLTHVVDELAQTQRD